MPIYRKLLNSLKGISNYPVSVRRVQMPGNRYGDCGWHGDRFIIRIDRELCEDLAIQILIHEFAHVLAWDEAGSDHGPAWGAAYARAYRVYEGVSD